MYLTYINFLFSDLPVVSLKMGSSLNPDDIKEGDDVYFECNVRANPKPHRLAWYHNVSTILNARTKLSLSIKLANRSKIESPVSLTPINNSGPGGPSFLGRLLLAADLCFVGIANQLIYPNRPSQALGRSFLLVVTTTTPRSLMGHGRLSIERSSKLGDGSTKLANFLKRH